MEARIRAKTTIETQSRAATKLQKEAGAPKDGRRAYWNLKD
jgi:hypothetical protein